MRLRSRQPAVCLGVALALVVSAPIARAAESGQPATTKLAGPWYTPPELKALIAYSNASSAQKRTLLAGRKTSNASSGSFEAALAGPRYTPSELKALVAYSKASFAQKKALLAGSHVSSTSTRGFRWADAGIGAGVATGFLLLTGILVLWFTRTRRRQRRLQSLV